MFLFTIILKPIRVYLSKRGVPVLIYLDDGIVSGRTFEEAASNREIFLETLAKAGFVVSLDKTKGPASRILFLGLEICSSTLKFYIPESKVLKIIEEAKVLLSSRKVKVRSLARFVGLLQSCGRALGGIVRLRTRLLYAWLNEKLEIGSYDFYHALSEKEKEELSFWISNLNDLNGYFFDPKLSCLETNFSVVTDASSSGMFGYQISSSYEILLRKMFTAEEVKSSSTVRELLALKNIYCSVLVISLLLLISSITQTTKRLYKLLKMGAESYTFRILPLISFMLVEKRGFPYQWNGSLEVMS